MNSIGPRLQKFRVRAGRTARDIAREISVAESTYRAWEAGRAIRGEPYLRLAKALKISLHELFGDEPTNAPEIDATIKRLEGVLEELRKIRAHLT